MRNLRLLAMNWLNVMTHAKDENAAWHAAIKVGLRGSKSATRPLIHLIRRSSFLPTRRAAAQALWLLGDPRSRQVLETVVRNRREDAMLRNRATEALGSIPFNLSSFNLLVEALTDVEKGVQISALCALSAYVATGRLRNTCAKTRLETALVRMNEVETCDDLLDRIQHLSGMLARGGVKDAGSVKGR